MERARKTETLVNNCKTLDINCFAVNHVPFVAGQSQKKGIRPIVK